MNADIFNFTFGALFSYTAIGSFFSGFRLLTSKTFLSFHGQAVGTPWSEIPERTRLLILALMRVAGAGFIVASVLSIVNAFPSFFAISRNQAVVLGGGITVYWLWIYGITLYVHKRTNAATPFKSSFSIFLVTLVGTIGRAVA